MGLSPAPDRQVLGFQTLAGLPLELQAKPWAAPLIDARHPEALDAIARLVVTPFRRFVPYRKVGSRVCGPYTGLLPCQVGAVLSPSRNKWCVAGNRAGKTVLGLAEDLADRLGLSALTKQPGHRPGLAPAVDLWVVSDTQETSINICQRTLVEELLGRDTAGFLWNMVDDDCQYSDRSGFSGHVLSFTNRSRITFEFSTRKRNTFQGVPLHKVHHDEVQPRDIWGECMARLVDRRACFLGNMTPIYDDNAGKVIAWIYEVLCLRQAEKRVEFHQWSMLDNPHLPETAKRERMAHCTEDEVEARICGAFVPMGVKLAFPAPLLRALRAHCLPPARSSLALGEDGVPVLDIVPVHDDLLADSWAPATA
ncbi:MAG: hypothetical protein AB1505_07495 [Candidatus Latescibacterota bacterium]